MSLEDVRIHVIYRVNPSEYGIRILVAAPQEYVNIYSTRRAPAFCRSTCGRGCRSVTQITSQGYVCVYVRVRVCVCVWVCVYVCVYVHTSKPRVRYSAFMSTLYIYVRQYIYIYV